MKKKKFYEHVYFECNCGHPNDLIRFTVQDLYKEVQNIYFEIIVYCRKGFFNRIWESIKYIFGRKILKAEVNISRWEAKNLKKYVKKLLVLYCKQKESLVVKDVKNFKKEIYYIVPKKDSEHCILFIYDTEFDFMGVIVYLNFILPLGRRIILAWKHLFDYHCRYGLWDEFELSIDDLKALYAILCKVRSEVQ